MLILQVFIRIYIQFGGIIQFWSNIKEIKEQSPSEILQVSAGKTSRFVRTDATI